MFNPAVAHHALPSWHNEGIQQGIEELWGIFLSVLIQPVRKPMICVMGLDECGRKTDGKLFPNSVISINRLDSSKRLQALPKIQIRGEEQND
jgi:hypothetical protein